MEISEAFWVEGVKQGFLPTADIVIKDDFIAARGDDEMGDFGLAALIRLDDLDVEVIHAERLIEMVILGTEFDAHVLLDIVAAAKQTIAGIIIEEGHHYGFFPVWHFIKVRRHDIMQAEQNIRRLH